MDIRENVATKKFRMVFHNPNRAPNAEEYKIAIKEVEGCGP